VTPFYFVHRRLGLNQAVEIDIRTLPNRVGVERRTQLQSCHRDICNNTIIVSYFQTTYKQHYCSMSGMSAQTTLLYPVLQQCTNKLGDHLGNEKSEKNEDYFRNNFENLTDVNKHIITNLKSLRQVNYIFYISSVSPFLSLPVNGSEGIQERNYELNTKIFRPNHRSLLLISLFKKHGQRGINTT